MTLQRVWPKEVTNIPEFLIYVQDKDVVKFD